ncbi:MAG: nucleoid-associated protein [Proteocatella sp.]
MADLKKKGNDINIEGIVIHQVIKDAHSFHCNVKLAEKEIQATEREKIFVGNIKESYYKKSNPTYGIFGEGDEMFYQLLTKYVNKEISFLVFSQEATNYYQKVISRSAPATGGNLIFIHFLNTTLNEEHLLVLTINNKDGYVIDEKNLTIKNIKNLEMGRIDVACLINLTKWEKFKGNENGDVKTYLSFVRGNKGVSLYFMEFINCNNRTTSTESTKRLVNTIDQYYKDKNIDRDTAIQKKNSVFNYCMDCLNNKKEISLGAISALLDNENPDAFKEYAGQEEFGVSEIISGDKTQLRKIKYTDYVSDKLTIKFSNDELDKTIFYDKKKKILTLKKLPQELIKELEK